MSGRGITVDFTAQVARFTSGIDKATNDLSRFQSNADRTAKNINNILGNIGVGLSAAGVVAFGKSVIDGLDKLNDLSKTTGLAVNTLSGLGLAAKQSGSDLDGVAKSIAKLSVEMGKDGGKFRQLGITAKDPLEAFKQLADVFVAIKDPQERAAIAAAALGKSWETAAPLLSEGGAAIGRMVADGERASGVTADMAAEADKFNDQLEAMRAKFAGVAVSITGEFLPAMNSVLDKLRIASQSGGIFGFFTASNEEEANAQKTIDGLKQKVGSLQKLREELTAPTLANKLNNTLLGSLLGGGTSDVKTLDNQIFAIQKKISYLQGLVKSANEVAGEADSPKAAPSKTDIADFLGNSAAADTAAKALADRQNSFIESLQKESAMLGMTASEMKVYEAGLLKISGAKLDGVKASAERIEAFKAEKAALKDQITFEASQADEFYRLRDNAAKEAQQAIEAMNKEGQNLQLAVDPMARLNSEIERYSVLLEAGAISQKTFDLAVEKSADNMKKATEDGFDKMNAAMIGFQTNVQSTLGQGLYNAMTGKFDGIFAAWRDLLFRMISAGLAAQVSESIFGANGKGGLLKAGLSILGSLGGLGKSPAPGALGSSTFGQSLWPVPKFAAGGDFMGGLRLVGENGPELEMTGPSRIFNAGQTKNILSGGRSASINYAPVINIDSRTDRSEVHAIVTRAVKQGNADLVDKLNRQGVI
jgi:hypothetical protein